MDSLCCLSNLRFLKLQKCSQTYGLRAIFTQPSVYSLHFSQLTKLPTLEAHCTTFQLHGHYLGSLEQEFTK